MGCGNNREALATTQKEDNTQQNHESTEVIAEGKRSIYNKKTQQCIDGEKEDKLHPEDDDFNVEDVGKQEAMATKAFMGAVKKPNNCPPFKQGPPNIKFRLEYVYGYRCEDSRQNCFYTSDNRVVFMTAALGVVLDPISNTQTFFGGKSTDSASKFKTKESPQHTDDILALAMSEDRKLVVTGQAGSFPTIFCWDADSKAIKDSVKLPKGTRGVCAIGFSSNGNQYACVDKHNDHNIYIMKVGENTATNCGKNGPDAVFDLAWSKKPDDNRFVVCGTKNIYFYQLGAEKKRGVYGTGQFKNAQTDFTCAIWNKEGICFTGGANGYVYRWDNCNLTSVFQAHKGAVHSINYCEGFLISGGSDKHVRIFDGNLKLIKDVPVASCPRAVDMKGGKLLLGLRDGSIVEYANINSQAPTFLMYSHSEGEVWGLDTTENLIVTTGDDNKAFVWDYRTRKMVKKLEINPVPGAKIKYGASTLSILPDNQCSRSVCINKKNGHIAIATNNGELYIKKSAVGIETQIGQMIKVCDRWIEGMNYSPCGKYLAVGTHTSTIEIYEVNDSQYARLGNLNGHSSAVISVDWSADSKYIRSNSIDYELLFWDVVKLAQDTNGATNTQGVEWATHSCKITYTSLGMFPPSEDYTHINSVAVSSDMKYIVNGDDWGLVNIYNYPSPIDTKPFSISLRGHSEHVMRVVFNKEANYIFSVGGYDQTLMQWIME